MLLHCTVCTRFFFYLFQEREVDFLAKEFELAKERQAEFLGDRYTVKPYISLTKNCLVYYLSRKTKSSKQCT